MAYSTDADLYDRIDEQSVIELTDDSNSGTVDQDILDNTRADVSEFINTFLRGRYDVPLDPAPAVLVNIEADLLLEKLYHRRPHIEITDSLKQRKKEAIDTLKMISRGEMQLEDLPDPGKRIYRTNKKTTDRRFPSDILRGY